MDINARTRFEHERHKVSEAGRTLREWQEKMPLLLKQVHQEEAGQKSLDLGDEELDE